MLLVDLLGWWYSRGWAWAARHLLVTKNARILQFFSTKDLLKTLFSPFRQDVLQLSGAPIGVRLQAFGMNLISRFFGLLVRSILIVGSLLVVCANTLFAIAGIAVWPLLPLSPVLAIIFASTGVGNA